MIEDEDVPLKVVVYDAETGAIRRVVTCDLSDVELQSGPDESHLVVDPDTGPSDVDQFVDIDAGELREKFSFDLTHFVGDLSVVFESLPPGVEVKTEGQTLVTDNDPTEVTVELPGTYTLEFRHAHYLDNSLEVTFYA